MIEGAFAQAGLELRVAVEAGGWEIVKRYVAMGLGVSVVPDFVIRPADRRVLGARSVRGLFGEETYGSVRRGGRELSRSASAFLSELAERS